MAQFIQFFVYEFQRHGRFCNSTWAMISIQTDTSCCTRLFRTNTIELLQLIEYLGIAKKQVVYFFSSFQPVDLIYNSEVQVLTEAFIKLQSNKLNMALQIQLELELIHLQHRDIARL